MRTSLTAIAVLCLSILTVSTPASADQPFVLEVADDGEGIGDEERERIFERFFRGSRTRGRHPDGSGLGLAIVKRVAEMHGGRAWIESTPPHGAAFHLSFPTSPANANAA